MRPQQNRRMRGRSNNNNNNSNNNNNRRGPNPLSRNYESNGPDVKIRGNAQHIADKYAALARDAQASGDRIMAENYLQHAEHYTRIILAAQAQMPQPVIHEELADDDQEETNNAEAIIAEHGEPLGSGPQPDINGTPAEVALFDDGYASENGPIHTNGKNYGDAEQQKAARQTRRTPRRRLANKKTEDGSEHAEIAINIAHDSHDNAENHAPKNMNEHIAETIVNHEVLAGNETADEVKPRRRRTVKSKTVTAE